MSIPTKIEAFIRAVCYGVDDGGLIFYLVYEFERLRLFTGVSTVPSQTTVRVQTEQNNARAGFAPDELFGFRDDSASSVHLLF
jgi:hypothetical protein